MFYNVCVLWLLLSGILKLCIVVSRRCSNEIHNRRLKSLSCVISRCYAIDQPRTLLFYVICASWGLVVL